jgi:hypothetical protein
MRVETVFLYLTGDRRAILQLAASPWTLLIGAIFVLSAGLARDYDGEDLLREPWHLLIPFAASIAASLILFGLACLKVMRGETWPGLWRAYLSFLGLFWMTAPLAWLYAVPYERFLSAEDAMGANLLTLGVVAIWRVILMIRVLIVVWNYGVANAVFVVMAFADAAALTAIVLAPVPVIQVMSGGRGVAPTDRMIQSTGCMVAQLGACTAPIWLIALTNTIAFAKSSWQAPRWGSAVSRPTWAVWLLAVGSLLFWVPFLPATQSEQALRRDVENDFKEGRISEAVAQMAAHDQNDFPPHWSPPPRLTGFGDDGPKLLEVWEILVARPHPQWLHDVYVEHLRIWLQGWGARHCGDTGRQRLAQILTRIPEGQALVEETQDLLPDELRELLPKELHPRDGWRKHVYG